VSAAPLSDRSSFIDVWRGVSILLVVAYHFTSRVPSRFFGAETSPSIGFAFGNVGVLIFFVLSGYLISKTLGSAPTLADFYARRLSRIWPLFIVAAFFVYGARHLLAPPIVPSGYGVPPFGNESIEPIDLVATIFFAEQLGFDWVDGAFWSILVELKFYFLAGLMAALLRRNPATSFALLSSALALNYHIASYFHFSSVVWLLHSVLVADYLPFFAVGMLLQQKALTSLLAVNVMLCAVAGIALVPEGSASNFPQSGLFLAALAGALLADGMLFANRVMLWIGRYSYSIYLFHQVIGLALIRSLAPSIGIDVAIIVAVAAVFALAWIASDLFEWRFRRQVTGALVGLMALAGLRRFALGRRAHEGSQTAASQGE